MTEPALVIVSDLHLGGGRLAVGRRRGCRDSSPDDQALSDFLHWLSTRPECRLVFLGDTFDFLEVPVTGTRTGLFARSDTEAVDQLDRIAAAHSAVMDGLSAVVAAGMRVGFVSGNHDAELIRPAVQDRLCALAGGHVQFHPWLLYIPGLLYAEHGHQHHDINAFTCPAYPYAKPAERLERPPAAWLSDLRHFRSAPGRPWRDVMTGLRGRPPASRRADYRGQHLPAYAAEIGLPAQVAGELHGFASFSPLRSGQRLVRRRWGGTGPGYLPAAAGAVHDLLARNQLAVPFYAFGHTHEPMRLALGADAWYLNSGTWAARAPGRARRTWVEITASGPGGEPAGQLFHWAGAAEPLAGDGTQAG